MCGGSKQIKQFDFQNENYTKKMGNWGNDGNESGFDVLFFYDKEINKNMKLLDQN